VDTTANRTVHTPIQLSIDCENRTRTPTLDRVLDARAWTPVLRLLAVCLHLLMAGLLALAAVRALTGEPADVSAVVLAGVTGLVYAVGPSSRRVRDSMPIRVVWLATLGAAWLALLALSPEGIWVAFPMFFVQLHLLPGRWGVATVGVTTILAIAGFGWHQHDLNPGTVLGPVLGAAVAVATVRGYQALHAESEQRRQLIEELVAARDDLAVAERTAGTLAERDRLASEIHDTLTQGLSSIQLLLRAAERSLPDDTDTATNHVTTARSVAQDNLAEARRFVHELSPPDLAEGSLPSALERLCTETQATSTELSCRFELHGAAGRLSTQYEVTLLRIAQSALANATQHANAGQVVVTLQYSTYEVTLRVADDGVGFDSSTGSDGPDHGFGLPMMRQRAGGLGGTVTVDTTPGSGTAIIVNIPLPTGEGAT